VLAVFVSTVACLGTLAIPCIWLNAGKPVAMSCYLVRGDFEVSGGGSSLRRAVGSMGSACIKSSSFSLFHRSSVNGPSESSGDHRCKLTEAVRELAAEGKPALFGLPSLCNGETSIPLSQSFFEAKRDSPETLNHVI
jgi:hypothetical protein